MDSNSNNNTNKVKVGYIGCRSYGVAYDLPKEIWMAMFEEIDRTKNITRVAKAHKIKRQSLSRKYNQYKKNNVDPADDLRGYCKKIFTQIEELHIFDQLWNNALVYGFEEAFSTDAIIFAANNEHQLLKERKIMKPFNGSVGWANCFKKRHGIEITNGNKNYYMWDVLV